MDREPNKFRLKSIRIQGFQSFKDQTFEFGDVTVIAGFSDSGKSAVVRAFRAVISGGVKKSQIKVGEAKAVITVTRQDGKNMVLERGAGPSKFIIEGIEFTKFGAKSPTEVFSFLGWDPVKIDKDQMLHPCLTGQHDNLMLISAPPTHMAKTFARMSGAHILHSGIRLGVNKEQAVKRDKDVALRDFNKASDELISFSSVPARNASLEVQKSFITAATSAIERRDKVAFAVRVEHDIRTNVLDMQRVSDRHAKVRSAVEEIKKKIEIVKEGKNKLNKVKSVLNLQNSLVELESKEAQLSSAVSDIEMLTQKVQKSVDKFELLRKAASITIPDLSLSIDLMEQVHEKMRALRGVIKFANILEVKKEHNEISKRARAITKELESIRVRLEEFPSCPLCGSELRE